MALALEIEYLSSVCFASIGQDSDSPDWPPQPDRIFSALVATWGAHGELDTERVALEWLEALPPPSCIATEPSPRMAPIVFVPPNDARIDRAKHAPGVLPALRSRQPRRFPAAYLSDPVVRYFWDHEPDEETLALLDILARDTAYVGHSTSLTRCRFMRSEPAPSETLQLPIRCIYKGRLEELRAAYKRFQKSANKKDRPSPGALVPTKQRISAPRLNVFSDRWLILEHIDGEMPDLRAAPIVARHIRTTLMSGYGQIGAEVPACVSGHDAGGSATREPHLAIVPLTFTGYPQADGRVLGFALVPPATSHDLLEDEIFRKALRKLSPLDDEYGRRVLEVKSPTGTPSNNAFAIKLSPSFETPPQRSSLDPAIYTGSARRFATVTPIVLDRFLKKQGEARLEEIAEQIATACQHIGLPEPSAVFPNKHSVLQGTVSAYPSGRAPVWMRWRLPEKLGNRQLTHAVIHFAKEIEGPLLLGAGRFVGMGVCRPLERGRD